MEKDKTKNLVNKELMKLKGNLGTIETAQIEV